MHVHKNSFFLEEKFLKKKTHLCAYIYRETIFKYELN